MDLKILASAVLEVAEERGIPQEKIFEVIEEALASAYKKEYGKRKQKIAAKLFPGTGKVQFWQVREVVSEDMLLSEQEIEAIKKKKEAGPVRGPASNGAGEEIAETGKTRFNPERHILLEEAKHIDPKITAGQEINIPLEPKEDFGRIAAQTAKQVILQKIKEIEKDETFKEYKEKEGEVVSGIVQRIEPNVIFLDIGRTSGILPKNEQIYSEHYRIGQRLKLYVLATEQTPKGPQVVLSRIYPKLISKLFELEVPEVAAGQVEIKSIAREAGSRSKIAVTALEEGIDPIGALVGQRGTRILAVINEIGGEKIDVIEWADTSEKYVANALSPAKVLEVRILPKNKAQAIIPDEQLSLAIGKEGQNVRLAAKLTGWKIDVRSASQIEQELKEKREGKAPAEPAAAAEPATEKPAEPEVKAEPTEKEPVKKEKAGKEPEKEKKTKPKKTTRKKAKKEEK